MIVVNEHTCTKTADAMVNPLHRQKTYLCCAFLLPLRRKAEEHRLLFYNHDRNLRFLDHFLADTAYECAFEQAQTTAAHDDDIAILLVRYAHDGFGDIARLDMLGRPHIIRNLLPDAVEDDMARYILIDVAGHIDEIEVGFTFFRKEYSLINSLGTSIFFILPIIKPPFVE